jgi:hypothetical protein
MMETEIIDRFSEAPPDVSDGIKIRGFFRLQIEEDGEIVGDSGWMENAVTNEGKRHYLAQLLGGLAGSSQIGYAALGTGTAPGATATTLDGELGEAVRDAVSAATSGSTAVAFTGTFASSDSFVTATRNLSNIGLFATNSGGSIFAGNTYASSSCGTNQNVNYTYTITFS